MEINKLTEQILKCAYKVHSELGLGLLESAYEECLFYELKEIRLLINFNVASLKNGIKRLAN